MKRLYYYLFYLREMTFLAISSFALCCQCCFLNTLLDSARYLESLSLSNSRNKNDQQDRQYIRKRDMFFHCYCLMFQSARWWKQSLTNTAIRLVPISWFQSHVIARSWFQEWNYNVCLYAHMYCVPWKK